MKNIKLAITLPVVLVILGLVGFKIYDDNTKGKVIQKVLSEILTSYHFQKSSINNEFSERVYKLYMERLDYSKRFLIQKDVDKLKKYKHKLDEQIKNNQFDFFDISAKLMPQRIEDAEKYFETAIEGKLDFTKDEKFETDPEKVNFAGNKKELKDHWRKLIKYSVMTKMAGKLKVQETALADNDTSVKQKTVEQIEIDSRKEVKKTYSDWFHRLKRFDTNDRRNWYFSSITFAFGPHTEYYPPKDKKNFDIRMSGKLEGIGATLTQPNAYIKIAQIVPGSPCWKTNGAIAEGDLILKVAQGDSLPVDVVDMRMDDAIKMIRGPKGTEVRLTIKKKDGSIKIVPIIRDVIMLEATFAKSAVMQDSITGERIGYLFLPQFYANFQEEDGRRCAKDVEKELIKLNKEKIDGLVFDLRNNGGGSLQDVVEMFGLFIDKGPVVQVKARKAMPHVLRDKKGGVLYEGPLAVMINGFSASASEIMAAAIQDYGRGIVVGSKATFGKGTVQRFIGLDDAIRDKSNAPYGSLKLTTQKFYRVNGGSTQLKGVNSDIELPDMYSKLDMGEKDMDYPIKWDDIDPAEYTQVTMKKSIKELRTNSNARTQIDTSFLLIDEYATYMKKRSDETVVTLNLKEYRQQEEKRFTYAKKFNNAGKRKGSLKFITLKDDSLEIYSDTVKTARAESWHKKLNKDIYISEAFKIVSEMQ